MGAMPPIIRNSNPTPTCTRISYSLLQVHTRTDPSLNSQPLMSQLQQEKANKERQMRANTYNNYVGWGVGVL